MPWDAVRGPPGGGNAGFDQAGLDLAQARFTSIAEDHERREERRRQDSRSFPAYHLAGVLRDELRTGFEFVVSVVRAQAQSHAVRSAQTAVHLPSSSGIPGLRKPPTSAKTSRYASRPPRLVSITISLILRLD
jgi:hypothetical protein